MQFTYLVFPIFFEARHFFFSAVWVSVVGSSAVQSPPLAVSQPHED